MNPDEKGMDTDSRICFAKHPSSSAVIRVHHLQALRPQNRLQYQGMKL
jgi:hypothetical protein